MNRAVVILSITAAGFAASTVYFAHQLQLERSRNAAPDVAVAAAHQNASASGAPGGIPEHSPATASAAPAAKSGSVVGNGAAGTAAAATLAKKDPNRELMAPFAKDFLRQYDDMALRPSLVANVRPAIESQYVRLRDKLKLEAATFKQLVDLIAEEGVEAQASYYLCMLDAACDLAKNRPVRDRSDELQALLGDDYSKFTSYRSALPEWQSVVQLRGRLPESLPLRDSEADRLLAALSEERDRFTKESSQAGASLRGWGTGAGMLWYSADGTAEQQLASARDYMNRMRQRAAGVLSEEQLRVFVQLQEELLAQFTNFVGMAE